MKKEKGFTMVELLVTIAIIGFIATIAVIALGSVRAKARDTRRKSDIQQIIQAIEMYRENNAGQPPNTGGTIYCLGAASCWGGGTNSAALDAALAPYLPRIPVDPLENRLYNAYIYRTPGAYWLPSPVNTVTGGAISYSIAWKPDIPDNKDPTVAECEATNGIWAAWDIGSTVTHCPSGGSCRQCGIVIE